MPEDNQPNLDLNTVRLSPSERGIRAGVSILARGGLVAFPTETVYGLGADARSERAVAGIYRAKGRPVHNPLIVHVAEPDAAAALINLGDTALALQGLWPGPLTLVASMRESAAIPEICRAGGETLAVRVPASPIARDLLMAFGGPVAAPSANRSGRVSATSADHVMEELRGRIDAVIDGGECMVGLESTILEVGPRLRLLRPGGVPLETLEAAVGPIEAEHLINDVAPSAPGQLTSHYAPRARLRLDADAPQLGEAWLGFGPGPERGSAISLNLSEDARLDEAATHLFAHLRELDRMLEGSGVIAVASIPNEGLGRAINDRLARAAAGR